MYTRLLIPQASESRSVFMRSVHSAEALMICKGMILKRYFLSHDQLRRKGGKCKGTSAVASLKRNCYPRILVPVLMPGLIGAIGQASKNSDETSV